MIKTDKVVYRTRTLEEYDWLMEKLEEAGCRWADGKKPSEVSIFCIYKSSTRIYMIDKELSYNGESDDDDIRHSNFEGLEVSDLMKNEEKENLIRIDKAVYRVRNREEHDWLMKKLDEVGCTWGNGCPPIDDEDWSLAMSDSHIWVRKKTISYSEARFFYDYYKDRQDYVIFEVSDIMENEKKIEVLDKLETMNEHLNNKLKKLEEEDDESQKIKKVVYTTEVYFE